MNLAMWLPVLISFLTTLLLLLVMLRRKLLGNIVALPNERSLHAAPIPRTGGLALMAGILVAWGLQGQCWLLPLAGCLLFLMLLSFIDDLRGLGAGVRFLAHVVAAGVFSAFGLALNLNWIWMVIAAVAIIWMTNLYNFMDGSDGLAGGMALFGFGSYAVAAWLSGNYELAGAAACIAASALAFLAFNFHPARIFLGDTGSIPLGFMAAAIGLLGWQCGNWPIWFPLLVFSPFIVDATLTLFKRLLRGEKIWQAHRSHYYQRLVRMGLGHRDTAICEYVLMLVAGCSAIWLAYEPMAFQMIGLSVWSGIYVIVALWIDRSWRQFEQSRMSF